MFYYLLSRNCDMKNNLEEISSITVIKYMFFLSGVKIFEYKYLERGFFNYYIIALIIADMVFTLYRFINLKNNGDNNIQYTDDITNDGFSMSAYKDEINNIRYNFLKRRNNESHIYQHNISKDMKEYNRDNDNNKDSEINTTEHLQFLNTMLNSEIDIETPSRIDIETPSRIDIETPSKIDIETPSKIDIETQSRIDIESPSKIDIESPSKIDTDDIISKIILDNINISNEINNIDI